MATTMASWGGHQLQAVWFITTPDGLDAARIFEAIWGQAPDQVQRNRVPGPTNPLLGLAASQFDDRHVQVQLQPGRLDVIQTAVDTEDGSFSRFFNVHDALSSLLSSVERYPPVDAPVVRLALVCTTLKPHKTYEACRSDIQEYTGFSPPVANASDMLVQLNKRTTFQDCTINRLINSSVIARQSMLIELSQSGPRSVAVPQSSIEYAARKHFDLNTVPDGKAIEISQHFPILSFMSDEIRRLFESDTIATLDQ